MNIPGFSAEATLYRTRGYYHMVATGMTSSGQVVPALPSCGNCDWACDKCVDCLRSGGTRASCPGCGVCSHCSRGGCGGGGGGVESCRLHCASARHDCYIENRTNANPPPCDSNYNECLRNCSLFD